VVRDGGREQSQRPGALHDHALVRLDASHAVEGVNDGAQRAARGGGHAVGHAVRDTHASGGREHIAVLREAADQVGEALAVGPHVLLLAAAERGRVLHAALVALPAVDVGPQEPIADRERLADRVLARPRAERDHGAHHLVAQHDRQLRGRQRLRHPVPLMHVRAADRCDVDAHEQGAGLELVLARHRQLADLDRLAVLGDDGGAGGLGQAHGAEYTDVRDP
jgi:hypothetical protein